MTTTDLTSLLPLLLLCCLLPMMMGRGQGGGQSAAASTQMDIWFTGYTSEEAFDSVVKTIDEVRQKAEEEAKTRKSRFSFLRRGRRERYAVEQTIPPHLYRVNDGEDGIAYFEFSDAEGGGTQVKTTFSDRTKTLTQNLKAKMPPRKMTTGSAIACPSCGRPKQPEWQFCPYDGNKYS